MTRNNRFSFTLPRVEKAECEEGKQQSFVWDTNTPGLGLRITSNGSKGYIFESRVNGKTLRLTLGNPRAWSLSKAQEEARRLQTLCDQGVDPRSEKASRVAAAEAQRTEKHRQQATLGELWPVYIEARRSRWGDRHLQDHFKLAQLGGEPVKRGMGVTKPGPLASLLSVRLCDLTPGYITTWVEKESVTRPARVALAHRLLIGFASWCKEQPDYSDLLPAGVFSSKAVRESIPKGKVKDDCLQREQLAAWFAAVRQESPVMSTYLQALLLTGARREEMAALRWGDVDFQWASLTIKDKVEGERIIPLTPYLSSLLACLPRRNEWVFSSPTSECGRIVEPRIAHNHALEVAGLPPLTLHGLRRSFGTLAEWVEAPAGVVAQIMGHKPSAIAEKHYRRRPLDLLRMWHTKIEGWILEQAGIEQSHANTTSPTAQATPH